MQILLQHTASPAGVNGLPPRAGTSDRPAAVPLAATHNSSAVAHATHALPWRCKAMRIVMHLCVVVIMLSKTQAYILLNTPTCPAVKQVLMCISLQSAFRTNPSSLPRACAGDGLRPHGGRQRPPERVGAGRPHGGAHGGGGALRVRLDRRAPRQHQRRARPGADEAQLAQARLVSPFRGSTEPLWTAWSRALVCQPVAPASSASVL